jgi:hypothetical protein
LRISSCICSGRIPQNVLAVVFELSRRSLSSLLCTTSSLHVQNPVCWKRVAVAVGGWEAAGTAWRGSSLGKNYSRLAGALFSHSHFILLLFPSQKDFEFA